MFFKLVQNYVAHHPVAVSSYDNEVFKGSRDI